jgi:hypothetical protein
MASFSERLTLTALELSLVTSQLHSSTGQNFLQMLSARFVQHSVVVNKLLNGFPSRSGRSRTVRIVDCLHHQDSAWCSD